MTRTFSKIFGAGGAAPRLGLLPAGGRRRAEPHPRAVQRAGAGAGRRRRRDRGPGACRRKAKAHNDRWLPWFAQRMTRARPASLSQRRQFRAGEVPERSEAQRRGGAEIPERPRASCRAGWAAYGLPDCLRITIAGRRSGQGLRRRARGLREGSGDAMSVARSSTSRDHRHRPDRLVDRPRRAQEHGLAKHIADRRFVARRRAQDRGRAEARRPSMPTRREAVQDADLRHRLRADRRLCRSRARRSRRT